MLTSVTGGCVRSVEGETSCNETLLWIVSRQVRKSRSGSSAGWTLTMSLLPEMDSWTMKGFHSKSTRFHWRNSSALSLGARNRLRRSSMVLRMVWCQFFETERAWVKSLVSRCDKTIMRSSGCKSVSTILRLSRSSSVTYDIDGGLHSVFSGLRHCRMCCKSIVILRGVGCAGLWIVISGVVCYLYCCAGLRENRQRKN
jgi:hypothetical protein